MTPSIRAIGGAAVLSLVAAACGGTAVAPSAAPVVTAAVQATPAPTPATAKPIVAATGLGSTSVKLSEAKVTLVDAVGTDLTPGAYLSTVSLVTLEKGGRTAAHKHGGLESIYVLEGTIDFRTANGGRIILTRGQTASAPANTALQAVNGGDGIAKFLAFFLTAEAATFQTPVDEAP